MLKMHKVTRCLLVILACLFLGAIGVAAGSDEIPAELIGTWDYTSLTALKDGKPSGTVHFKLGQWTLKLNADATYLMKPPPPAAKPEGVSGTYKVHGHDLDLSPANGAHKLMYHFSLKHDGKVLELKDKGTMITASRE